MKNNGIVNIHGREYQTVALRVSNFKAQYPEHALLTQVLHRDDECVLVQATIFDKDRRAMATGHAEEYRASSTINRTSALENAETSAIGRALAAFGLGGTEFASADEVARAVSGEKQPAKVQSQVIKATDGIENMVPEERRYLLDSLALDMITAFKDGRQLDAVEWFYGEDTFKDNEERVYLWKMLSAESKLRAFIKQHNPNKAAA